MSDTEPEEVKSLFRTPKKEENLPDAVPGNEAQENLGSKSSSPTIRTKNAFICLTVSVVVLFILSSLALIAAATINFSLAWVRLLIEGGSYSRAAFY